MYVKTELQKRSFISRDFANLPLDMSTGSRELLLALGWLLCKEDIIAKFMQTCTTPLEEQDTAYLYKQVPRASCEQARECNAEGTKSIKMTPATCVFGLSIHP